MELPSDKMNSPEVNVIKICRSQILRMCLAWLRSKTPEGARKEVVKHLNCRAVNSVGFLEL
jgi:hypothetical protein